MPRWLFRTLRRVRALAEARRIRLTHKALRELEAVGLDVDDACDLLTRLRVSDSAGRVVSESTGEWLYVFRPRAGGQTLYVKLVLRSDCVVVSLHRDSGGGDEAA